MALLDRVSDVLGIIDGMQVQFILSAVLAALDLLVFVLAGACFQRSWLALD